MSKRDDYYDNYFNGDDFNDNYNRRLEYRRRQSRRKQGGRRPVYKVYSLHRKNKRRTRNRIIIVLCGILILMALIFLLSAVFRGCFNRDKTLNVSTGTIPPSTVSAAAAADKENDELSSKYFKTPKIKDDGSDGELAYNIYVWNNSAFELFNGTADKAKTYAQAINEFAEKLNGVKVYDMVIPNHTEMGLPQRLKDGDAASSSQADNIKSIYQNLSNKVTPVNAYNYLADHNDEYTYFNSDHHWTGLGAYYAYQAFAKTTDQPVLSLDDCQENKIDGFTGSFTNTVSTLDSDYVSYWSLPYNVTMDITSTDGSLIEDYQSAYYQAAEAGQNTYGVFIVGDHPLTVMKSGSEKAGTDKKIAVIKESYGNAFVPYLTYNYNEVHVIDFRYFNQNLATYCKENDISEVLFINGVMSANTQIQIDSMSGLFS